MHASHIFLFSFLLQYFVMSGIMSNSVSNVTHSLEKAYLGIIMGLLMVMMDVGMRGPYMSSPYVRRMLSFGVALLFFILLYKTQFGVTDAQYLREMKEHHSMALLTSAQILRKTTRSDVAALAQRIQATQESEITEMDNLLLAAP
jgi:uncharacterized protein YlxW (UPF0749 family)